MRKELDRSAYLDVYSQEKKKIPETFSSVAVIGATGQTGQLFIENLAGKTRIEGVVRTGKKEIAAGLLPDSITMSDNLKETLSRQPEAIIVATPNPIIQILNGINEYVSGPLTIILPQNGVEAPEIAKGIFKKKPEIQIICASLFTPVSLDAEGKAIYPKNKLRMAISSVPTDSNSVYFRTRNATLKKTHAFFQKNGFKITEITDYKSMLYSKLVLNCVGLSSAVTGFDPRRTFMDPDLFEMEIQGIKDHLMLLKAANIPPANFPWQNTEQLQQLLRLPFPALQLFKKPIAYTVSKGRNNEPSAAARKIKGKQPTEVSYYLNPFIELAKEYGLYSAFDETIYEIITLHESKEIDLNTMTEEARKKLLLDAYNKHKLKEV